jgi:two-component system heavy metal sensor histidine kinase CusS
VTRVFALTTGLLVLGIAGFGALFLRSSVEREIAGILKEELDELELGFPATSGTRADMADLVARLQADHPSNPMAFRVWGPDGEPWAELGTLQLLSEDVPMPRGGPAQSASRGRRWRVGRLPTGHLVGVVVDGSAQFRLLRQFGLMTLGLALLAGALAFVGGAVFVRRACAQLEQVASQARAVRSPSDPVEIGIEDAPEEIRAVAQALATMLGNIRAEHERAQLLIAGLAHELGSPIQNLIGEAQVALMKERSAVEHQALLESQLEELRDLARTVGNLVALCALGQDRTTAQLEEFDLGEEAALRLARERAHARRRQVALEVATLGDLRLRGDREAMMLALSNLVSNAIDWSPAGGRVQAALEGDERGVRVTVDDEGPGVPEADRTRVFEPFFRGAAASGRRHGYGLGLSIARAAVCAHGGEIEVGRSPLGGARFRAAIPRADVARAAAQS